MTEQVDTVRLRDRLAAIGLAPERLDATAAELGKRLKYLRSVPQDALEGIPLAVEFEPLHPGAEEP